MPDQYWTPEKLQHLYALQNAISPDSAPLQGAEAAAIEGAMPPGKAYPGNTAQALAMLSGGGEHIPGEPGPGLKFRDLLDARKAEMEKKLTSSMAKLQMAQQLNPNFMDMPEAQVLVSEIAELQQQLGGGL